MPPVYKFVEVSPVTDEALETCVNEYVAVGWHLEGIRFVISEHSKRPSMAFVSFTRDGTQQDAPRKPRPLVQDEPRRVPEEAGARRVDYDDDGEPAVITAPHGTDVD
jgi:hypothetical protein